MAVNSIFAQVLVVIVHTCMLGSCSLEPSHGEYCRVPEVLASQLSTEARPAGEDRRQGVSPIKQQ